MGNFRDGQLLPQPLDLRQKSRQHAAKLAQQVQSWAGTSHSLWWSVIIYCFQTNKAETRERKLQKNNDSQDESSSRSLQVVTADVPHYLLSSNESDLLSEQALANNSNLDIRNIQFISS
ncbi:hypothetical protein EWB00_001460 [Schistosoma japonicum]|uniref:Uncharacterized protein n=1 Tax=Schistosoma japonicum TaxID=6182 RepID=A0A4Z2CKN9_SCHJA|nr:hypothetical protein EWB00_001460 [Schistosoma japonicum]